MSGVVVVRQVFRSSFWQGVAIVWALFVAFNLWDVASRGWPTSGVVALLVIAVISVFVYAAGGRPAVVADAAGIEIRNPMRTVHVPWNRITDIDATDVLRVHVATTVYRSWAVSRGGALASVLRGTGRKPAGAPDLGKDALAELARRSPADYAAATLTEIWRQTAKRTSGEVRVTWAWPEAVVLVALVVALVATAMSL